MIDRKDVYFIGEEYSEGRDLSRKDVAVIRPAVLEGLFGPSPKVITTSPCCTDRTRRLDFGDISSDLAAKHGGWATQCTHCKWHYRVLIEHVGKDPRLGLYGVRWISQGF